MSIIYSAATIARTNKITDKKDYFDIDITYDEIIRYMVSVYNEGLNESQLRKVLENIFEENQYSLNLKEYCDDNLFEIIDYCFDDWVDDLGNPDDYYEGWELA